MSISGGASKYLKRGAEIEISSNDKDLNGSWYKGRVVRPPIGKSNNVIVEYATLTEDGRPRKEVVDLDQVRPARPVESQIAFNTDDFVDAYHREGWWEGFITEAVGRDEYMVSFPATKDHFPFSASNLRPHRDWIEHEWDPPLEDPAPTHDKTPFSAEVEVCREAVKHQFSSGEVEQQFSSGDAVEHQFSSGEVRGDAVDQQFSSGEVGKDAVEQQFSSGEEVCRDAVEHQISSGEVRRDAGEHQYSSGEEVRRDAVEHQYRSGNEVEVSIDGEGFEGAWFGATVLKKLDGGKYVVEYHSLMDDNGADSLREEVDGVQMRPPPPDIGLVDRFDLHEEIDAWYNDAWWSGMISKVRKNDRYNVYFKNTDEDLKFDHSKLRVHQDWKNGKWYIASKVLS